ncbi:peptidoglycan -binding protein [Rhodobacteraceae bacterium NNCM2]|nr:peptidoglycan -binding protein [Coraliihabitans acroporae]
MALVRRSGHRFEANIWPGFVDALTALLLILMFVLSIFMIVQFSLRETITGQSRKLNDLNAQLSALTEVLSLERTKSEGLELELGTVRASLVDREAEADRLTAALAALSQQKSALETELAQTKSALTEAVDAREAVNLALAQARDEIDAQTEAARLDAARREAMQAMIAELNAQRDAREQEIVTLNADKASALALIAALQTEAQARDAELAEQNARVADLAEDQEELASTKLELEQSQAQLRRDIAQLTAQKAVLEADLEAATLRLTNEEEARLIEAAAAEALRKKLAEDAAELDAVTLALEQARAEAEQTLTLLAAAEAAKQRLGDELQAGIDDTEALRLELEQARARQEALERTAGGVSEAFDREAALRKIAEAELAKASEQSAEQARRVALLNEQVKQLNSQLAALQQLLDETAAKEAEGQVQISNLGSQLNAALARKVALEAENAELLAEKVDQLEQVRSIFLERVEGALAGREGIKRVGDRFVFQSEVLFGPGSSQLGFAGQRELTKLGAVLRELSAELPPDLDWILRVDGHTDRTPLSGSGRYRNNWELSQARALSVVDYLINREGVDPSRLAAAGFGEFQPIEEGEEPDSLARNRRIEFKFTER